MDETVKQELKSALWRTYEIIAHDLRAARMEMGGGETMTQDEVVEVVADQAYGDFGHVRVSDEAKAEWKRLCDPRNEAELDALMREVFPHPTYE